MAVMLKHLNDPLPRPKQYVPDIPDRVEQVLFSALAKDPNQRYQDMEAFAEALEKLVQENVIAEPIIEGTYVVPKQDGPSKDAARISESGRGRTQQRSKLMKYAWIPVLVGLVCVGLVAIIAIPKIISLISPVSSTTPTVVAEILGSTQEIRIVESLAVTNTLPPNPEISTPTLVATSSPEPEATVTVSFSPTPELIRTTESPVITISDCPLRIEQQVHLSEEARFWTKPSVIESEFTLGEAGSAVNILDGPEWGRIRLDIDYWGWWWEVSSTENNSSLGWVWEERFEECR